MKAPKRKAFDELVLRHAREWHRVSAAYLAKELQDSGHQCGALEVERSMGRLQKQGRVKPFTLAGNRIWETCDDDYHFATA